MTDITNIPLNKLTAWEGNVRKTQNKGIDELAASIEAHGLLQSLVVRKDGKKFAVVAGNRRLAALAALLKAGKIDAGFEVPCQVIQNNADATEISLAENTVRENMHPADECDAYRDLIDNGAPIADVAARFGKTEHYVKQRLKLARVSPVVIEAYRKGKLNLEQVQAFAVSDDHEAQAALFHDFDPDRNDADDIRDALTENDIAVTDKRVRYVTLKAYEKAGGTVRRDLFSQDEEGVFILDVPLLHRLVSEKLDRAAKTAQKEGWKWVEVHPEFDYQAKSKFHVRREELTPLCSKKQAELETLQKEYDELEEAPASPAPAEPGKKKGYDYGAYSPRGPVTVPAPPAPPAPPQPRVPDLAEGPKPSWIKERAPRVPITPKQPGVNFDTYAPKDPEPVAPAAPDVRDQKLKEEFQQPAAPPPPKPEPTIDPEIEVIRQRIFKRQQRENREFLKAAATAEREKAEAIERMAQSPTGNIDKMEAFDFQQQEALQAELQRHEPKKGVRAALRSFLNPEDEAKKAERKEDLELFRAQQILDRRAYVKSLDQERENALNRMRDELKALRDQHHAEQRDRNKGYDDELARRLRERQKAIDLARKESGWAEDFEKEQEQRWDDPDVPRRGK